MGKRRFGGLLEAIFSSTELAPGPIGTSASSYCFDSALWGSFGGILGLFLPLFCLFSAVFGPAITFEANFVARRAIFKHQIGLQPNRDKRKQLWY